MAGAEWKACWPLGAGAPPQTTGAVGRLHGMALANRPTLPLLSISGLLEVGGAGVPGPAHRAGRAWDLRIEEVDVPDRRADRGSPACSPGSAPCRKWRVHGWRRRRAGRGNCPSPFAIRIGRADGGPQANSARPTQSQNWNMLAVSMPKLGDALSHWSRPGDEMLGDRPWDRRCAPWNQVLGTQGVGHGLLGW